MFDQRQLATAERFGIREKIERLEKDILAIPDITDVSFNLDGLLRNICQVIIIVGYDIRSDREDYWDARSNLKHKVVDTANRYDLYRNTNPILDMGMHFYFDFGCMESWRAGSRRYE